MSCTARDRIEELGRLQAGWSGFEGDALSPEGLAWLADWMESQVAEGLPLPHLYPTPEGRVRAEWQFGRHDASLEIDLETRSGYWHVLDLVTDRDREEDVGLHDGAAVVSWRQQLVDLVRVGLC